MRFRLVGLSTLLVPTLCKIHRWRMTLSIRDFLRRGWLVGTSCQGVDNSKTKKPSPTINNYLLKHIGVTIIYTIYIYIYIYIYIHLRKLSLLLWLRDRQLKHFADAILLNFSESEVFVGDVLVLGEISFIIFFFVFGMDIVSLLSSHPETFIFIDSPGNKHFRLANQSQIISYSFTAFWLVSQSNALIYVCGKTIPSRYQFWLVIQSNHNIRAWLIKDPRPRLVGEYLFSL